MVISQQRRLARAAVQPWRIARWADRKLTERRNMMPPHVARLYERYASHPEGKHILDPLNSSVLYWLVRRHRPAHILDLGTGLGASLAIVAQAAADTGHGRVTSVEHQQWMMDLAQEFMPPHLAERVEFVLRENEIRVAHGREWSCYRDYKPESGVDLVIVDGPPTEDPWPMQPGVVGVRRPNGDLLAMLPMLRPGAMVFIDGRGGTVNAYRQHLGDRFRFHQHLGHTTMRLRKTSDYQIAKAMLDEDLGVRRA